MGSSRGVSGAAPPLTPPRKSGEGKSRPSMTITVAPIVTTRRRSRASPRERLQNLLPKLVLAPSFVLVLIFVYGFNLWTLFLSFTNSKAFASTKLVGLANYQKLWTWTFETDPPSSWYTALVNMGIFGGLYVVFLPRARPDAGDPARSEDPRRRHSAADLSLSARALLHRHRHGLEAVSRSRASVSKRRSTTGAGRASNSIGSSIRRMMIYCVAIAGIWQTSGFVMAMFLAGLRGVDGEIIKAAQIDGASAFATYRRIIIPIMRPVFLSAMIILTHMAIKSYDLVLSVTGKNPGWGGRTALHLHVFLYLHAQPDGGRFDERGDHADDDRRDHDPLSLLRATGEGPMSAADLVVAGPSREPTRHSLTTRIVIYGLLILFALDLSHAARRDGDDVAEAARRSHRRQHVRAAAQPRRSTPG